jgi:hypothetical protein
MNLFKRIGKKTPDVNKKIGIPATILAGIAITIAESGLVDHKPILKLGLEIVSAKLGAIALYNAQKTEKDGQTND